MKKKLVRFALLCVIMALSCATALAADGGIRGLTPEDGAQVTVTPQTADKTAVTPSGEDYPGAVRFDITVTNAQSGELYLVTIQNKEGIPTKDDLYFIDVQEAGSASVTINAYPKDMEPGTYFICLSSTTAALQKAASFTVYADGTVDFKLGDVDENGETEPRDATITLQIAARLVDATEQQRKAADADGNGEVEPRDATLILQKAAKLIADFPVSGT